jgi:hypothetical protein
MPLPDLKPQGVEVMEVIDIDIISGKCFDVIEKQLVKQEGAEFTTR